MKARIAAMVAVITLLALSTPANAVSLTYPYTAHVQDVGWMDMVGDGATAGTVGLSKRLEAVKFVWPGQLARGHVQSIGWQPWTAGDSTMVGTTGSNLRLEAVQVQSTIPGTAIECQAHVETLGWLPRVGNGEVCGTTGQGLRLEAIRFWYVDNN